MGADTSNHKLDKLLSDNGFCLSWAATHSDDGAPCFLKLASEEAAVGLLAANAILSESFVCQRRLHGFLVLKARRTGTRSGVTWVEYPLVDLSRWRPLSSECLANDFQRVFPILCLILDYLHSLELVHCDLKLENFLIDSSSDVPGIVLADMDFLRREGTSPGAFILGTAPYIAPEIVANVGVTAQADNYSFGVSLSRFLDSLHESAGSSSLDEPLIERLREAVLQLQQKDDVLRPRFLLDHFHEHGVIDDSQFEHFRRKLLGMLVVSHLRSCRRSSLKDAAKLEAFLVEQCRILGLDQNLVELMAAAYTRSRSRTCGLIENSLSHSPIKGQADFWHLLPDSRTKYWLYEDLSAVADGRPPSRDLPPVRELFLRAENLRKEKRYQRALTVYLMFLDEQTPYQDSLSPQETYDALLHAGTLAFESSLPREAIHLLSRAVDFGRARSFNANCAVERLVGAYFFAGDADTAGKLVTRELDLPETQGDDHYRLILRRIRAFRMIVTGNKEEGMRELEALASDPVAKSDSEVYTLLLYSYGIFYREKGERTEAIRYLAEAHQYALQNNLPAFAVPALTMLASVHAECSEYNRAIEMAKLAINLIEEHQKYSSAIACFSTLITAFITKAEYAKAGHWLQRLLYFLGRTRVGDGAISYYSAAAALADAEADLNLGRKCHSMTLRLLSTPRQQRTTLVRLARGYFYQGDTERCRELVRRSMSQIKGSPSLTSQVEAELLDSLASVDDNDLDSLVRTDRLVVRALELNSHESAVMGALQLMLSHSDRTAFRSIELMTSRREWLMKSDAPLMIALGYALETLKPGKSRAEELRSWKRAFAMLLKGHYRYWAALVGQKLSWLYEESARGKHARKYAIQAYQLAQLLPNPALISACRARIDKLLSTSDGQSMIIDSLLSISTMLKDMTDFRGSLTTLVQFAVDQTGAERGVLLLKRPESEGLQIMASVNCDEGSLSDVADFSSNLPLTSVNDMLPVVIENALADRRTKNLKSVVLHNILSVACIPLIDGNEPIGVLYLDHHSIPSLFEPDDLRYISSIANFLTILIATARQFRNLSLSNLELIQDLNRLGDPNAFITRDPSLLQLFDRLPQIARTNASVLICGESGTGKELLCHMVHNLSRRAKEPLIKLNCAAVPSTLIEAELFGVSRGAYTGAAERAGKLEAADGGTLFLDEIGEMPMEVQAKVLRVLEYQQFERLGSNRVVNTDVRFIYATNRKLDELIDQGTFRQDLYYRINRIVIEIPPLRQRPKDIPVLVEHYLQALSKGQKPPRFTAAAMEKLVSYRWPGNARELRNFVERCCILSPGERIDVIDLPREMSAKVPSTGSSKELSEAAEKARIMAAAHQSHGNVSQAAEILGMPLSTLRRKIKKYGIRLDF